MKPYLLAVLMLFSADAAFALGAVGYQAAQEKLAARDVQAWVHQFALDISRADGVHPGERGVSEIYRMALVDMQQASCDPEKLSDKQKERLGRYMSLRPVLVQFLQNESEVHDGRALSQSAFVYQTGVVNSEKAPIDKSVICPTNAQSDDSGDASDTENSPDDFPPPPPPPPIDGSTN